MPFRLIVGPNEREQEHHYLVRLKEDLQFEIGIMADYYSFIQHESGIGLDLEIQNLFTRITAGILSTAELVDIQENVLSRREVDIVPERAMEIAREFVARQNAVDLLPSIVQHHSFNKITIEASRDRAQQLIVTIDALIEEFSP